MTLTPGAYLKCRRTASGKSHEDVVDVIETDPAMSQAERIEWLKMIEADLVAVRWSTIVALRQRFPFDLAVLERLSVIHDGYDLPLPRLCRICASSDTGPLGIAVPAWGWDAPDLCIACASAT
ncbi:XRE family transcriptional regulator [Sphingomonas sp. Leaf62]|uniref:XRE family transcriptional regulator n=1 Tax=Sphingomonas sp. Leaf62 TaxID=1736228 RepID=UPI0012E22DCE|nr:XRE family transcriptional regulator [Sphingomonas sp. Leaf62]